LFENVTPMFCTWMKYPTFRWGEKVVTKVAPTIKVTIKNSILFVRS
jgi:hypothetical protein